MSSIAQSLEETRNRVTVLERRYGRPTGDVRVLAVSKTKPPEAVRTAAEAGQREFGENHVQDALVKLDALEALDLIWHFIGPVQSNKTRVVAARFDWVHSIDRQPKSQPEEFESFRDLFDDDDGDSGEVPVAVMDEATVEHESFDDLLAEASAVAEPVEEPVAELLTEPEPEPEVVSEPKPEPKEAPKKRRRKKKKISFV